MFTLHRAITARTNASRGPLTSLGKHLTLTVEAIAIRPMHRSSAVVALLLVLVAAAGCGRRDGLENPVRAGSLTLTLTTDPSPPLSKREVRFHLRVEEAGRPVGDGRVTLRLAMPGMNHGGETISMAHGEGGVYEGSGILVMGGHWEAAVEVTRPSGTVQATIPLDVLR